MELPAQIIVATRNRHKAIEFEHIFGSEVRILTALDVDPDLTWNETGTTFEENARIKIQAVSSKSSKSFPGSWILADDSGICVEALGGAPGVHSSSYGGQEGNDRQNTRRLLQDMERIDNRSACFRCCLILKIPHLGESVFYGQCDGSLIREGAGVLGFGYDPIFIPTGHSQTFAELPIAIKNSISHRARAFAALKAWLIQSK